MFFRLIILSTLLFSQTSFSHSGGTDSNGCHSGSQPYHCHNNESDANNPSTGIYHVAIGTTAALSLISAYYNFQHPIYLSANQSDIGLGASFLDPNKVLYINSKFYSNESVINIGKIISSFNNTDIDFYIGAGIYSEVIYFNNNEDEYEEENSFNLNLGLSKIFRDFNIFIDLDSGPKSLSFGITKII